MGWVVTPTGGKGALLPLRLSHDLTPFLLQGQILTALSGYDTVWDASPVWPVQGQSFGLDLGINGELGATDPGELSHDQEAWNWSWSRQGGGQI